MKRFLSLFLILLFTAALYSAEISFTADFPDSTASLIKKALEELSRGRGELSFELSAYSEQESSDGIDRVISFTLSFEEKSYDVQIPMKQGEEESAIFNEIEAILFYEPLLMEEGDLLDYIYKGSYSFIPENDYRLGSYLILVDDDGRKRGSFEVSGQYSEALMLSPVWLDSPYPGMKLKKGSDWRYSLSFASSFTFRNMIASAELGYSSLLYPFIPKLSFVYSYENGNSLFYGGIGAEASIGLGKLFNTGFTLIEEGRVGAGASLLLGGGSGFAISAVLEAYYEHWILPELNWRLGYKMLPGKISGMMVSIGGTF